MANQQLTDYVKEQLANGVTRDAVEQALRTAGWPEPDIKDAMGMRSPFSGAAAQPMAQTQQQPIAQPMATSPVAQQSAGTLPNTSPIQQPMAQQRPVVQTQPVAQQQSRPVAAAATPVNDKVIYKDFTQPVASSAMMQPAGTATSGIKISEIEGAMPTMIEKKPQMDKPAVDLGALRQQGAQTGKSPSHVGTIIMILLIVILAGSTGFMYKQMADASAQVKALTTQLQTANASVAAAGSQNQQQLDAVVAENKDLLAQLSLFSEPVAGGQAGDTVITLKGVIGTDVNGYRLVTSRNIAFPIRNSREPAVDAALKPNLGKEVEISGSHTPGLKFINAMTINGAAIIAPVSLPVPTSSLPFSTPTSSKPKK